MAPVVQLTAKNVHPVLAAILAMAEAEVYPQSDFLCELASELSALNAKSKHFVYRLIYEHNCVYGDKKMSNTLPYQSEAVGARGGVHIKLEALPPQLSHALYLLVTTSTLVFPDKE